MGDERGAVTVPCGKCENCKKRRVSNWSFRLMQEDKVSSSSYFLTLTYEPDSCPISKAGYMDLRKSDLQRFFKRLRKCHGNSGSPLKYYAVGEYGGATMRPHYHIILFNTDLRLLIGEKYAGYVKRKLIQLDGKTPYRCDAWAFKKGGPIGHITVGQVSEASVGYTMKYISKPSRVPMHRNDDRTPEFGLMSKRLGENYLTKAMCAWHKADMNNPQYCMIQDGKKIALPRYYKNKILNEQEQKALAAYNAKKALEEPTVWENTATERSESHFAGHARLHSKANRNKTF